MFWVWRAAGSCGGQCQGWPVGALAAKCWHPAVSVRCQCGIDLCVRVGVSVYEALLPPGQTQPLHGLSSAWTVSGASMSVRELYVKVSPAYLQYAHSTCPTLTPSLSPATCLHPTRPLLAFTHTPSSHKLSLHASATRPRYTRLVSALSPLPLTSPQTPFLTHALPWPSQTPIRPRLYSLPKAHTSILTPAALQPYPGSCICCVFSALKNNKKKSKYYRRTPFFYSLNMHEAGEWNLTYIFPLMYVYSKNLHYLYINVKEKWLFYII